MSSIVHVVAGVLRDDSGRCLLTRRPAGKHLAGLWEFPGGKCEHGEAPLAALRRELREEIGVKVASAERLIGVPWNYAEKSIYLDVYNVLAHAGVPHGREGQVLQWVAPEAMRGVDMPPADWPVVTALRLPRHYAISKPLAAASLLQQLERVLDGDVTLIQLRSKQLAPDALRALLGPANALVSRRGGSLLLNGHADLVAEFGLAGVHLPAADLMRCKTRPLSSQYLFAASCHDVRELDHAAAIGVDFAVLGPVLPTQSHPGQTALGWSEFARLCADAPFPVFALGGMSDADLPQAIGAGGQGIAGISAFWPTALG